MKSVIAALLFISNIFAISAFVVQPNVRARSPLAMALMADAPAPVSPPMTPSSLIVSSNTAQSSFQQQPASFNQYFEASSSSSSTLVSVQEYKKPTAEEIAAKKRNFNFWFWGGGFVAPFLATFYYFGLRFWRR
jgi:hypothetical protein